MLKLIVFIVQNLQDLVIMPSYTDSMNAFNRNCILFQNMLDFIIIVPVLQCRDVLG